MARTSYFQWDDNDVLAVLKPIIYLAPGRHANHYTTDVVFGKLKQTRLLDVKKKDLDWD